LSVGVAIAEGSQSAESNQPAATSQPHSSAQPAKSADKPGAKQDKVTIPALFLSDIHFEPFWDPGKVPQLAAAPASAWKAILAAPPAADREQRFAALRQTCHTRGDDTSYVLFESSLGAMRADAARPRFVTVSGDLMAHAFPCKFAALFPHSSPEDYRAFVEKTLTFVLDELGSALPGVPVYAALGNNDSDCGDYQLDAHSAFLADTANEFTRDSPVPERIGALATFAAGGYYSISLPSPIGNARLLVLNDIFMSSKYATCAGKTETTSADDQLAWLEQQLTQARRNKEKIWVMGHIPPGIDLHATVTKMRDVCGGQSPEMFLSSEKLADEMVDFSDVIELAIFAHTHMDEAHVLNAESGAEGAGTAKSVAMKNVPSISPINGNAPSFTVALVDPATASLVDFRVVAASNQTGVDAVWRDEYDFAHTYGLAAFSASSVSKLIAGFQADPSAQTKASRDYIRNFFVGNASPLLGLVWPQYVCSLANHSAQGFKSCVCSAGR
jgi:sphingomyelin phosphodiesterase acid-like 3